MSLLLVEMVDQIDPAFGEGLSVNAGSPRATKDKLASFEAWDARVRQAVIWIGKNGLMPDGASVADPVDSIERAKLDEPERQKLAAILVAAYPSMGDGKWRTVELIEKSNEAYRRQRRHRMP